MTRALSKSLQRLFRPQVTRSPDTHRRAREQAKPLAQAIGCDVEPLRPHGMNVWPPRGLAEELDPFDGDHFASDWTEALDMLKQYERIVQAASVATTTAPTPTPSTPSA